MRSFGALVIALLYFDLTARPRGRANRPRARRNRTRTSRLRGPVRHRRPTHPRRLHRRDRPRGWYIDPGDGRAGCATGPPTAAGLEQRTAKTPSETLDEWRGSAKMAKGKTRTAAPKKAERAVGDQVGHLVGDEVAAAGDQLDLHVVGVVLAAGEELGTEGGVVGAEEEPGRDREAGVRVAAAQVLGLLLSWKTRYIWTQARARSGSARLSAKDAQGLTVEVALDGRRRRAALAARTRRWCGAGSRGTEPRSPAGSRSATAPGTRSAG